MDANDSNFAQIMVNFQVKLTNESESRKWVLGFRVKFKTRWRIAYIQLLMRAIEVDKHDKPK